ncbi:hypothetical protein LIER_34956 [Lithospermum erythrorhizon]|uniref:Uncharacterized protein n=1 Tax=Lithospermum erythrorhizon TaxID=34254 RepID=A0AAV3NLD6_LITER
MALEDFWCSCSLERRRSYGGGGGRMWRRGGANDGGFGSKEAPPLWQKIRSPLPHLAGASLEGLRHVDDDVRNVQKPCCRKDRILKPHGSLSTNLWDATTRCRH